jgi:hypothetical protein
MAQRSYCPGKAAAPDCMFPLLQYVPGKDYDALYACDALHT